MLDVIFELAFYITYFGEGIGFVITVLIVLGGIGSLHSIFPIISVVVLITQIFVSIAGIKRRIDEGSGIFKSIIACIICNGISYIIFAGLAEATDIAKFVLYFIVFIPVWTVFLVIPWITTLRDGHGTFFPALIGVAIFFGLAILNGLTVGIFKG